MATYTTYVDPNSTAGGNGSTSALEGDNRAYPSYNAWEAAEQTRYSSGDEAIGEGWRQGANKDTTAVTISGWTAGVIPKIIVNPLYRHDGKWPGADGNTLNSHGNYVAMLDTSSANIAPLTLSTSGVIIDGLTIKGNPTDLFAFIEITVSATLLDVICTSKRFAYVTAGGITITCRNCVSFGSYDRSYNHASGATGTTSNLYNCIFYGAHANAGRVLCETGTINAINCFSMSFQGAGSYGSSDNNVSSDATAPGTTNARNQTSYADYFEDPANGNFHLKASSQSLWGIASANLYSTFTTDIDGNERPNSDQFGIGADYYVAAGGGTFKPFWARGSNIIIGAHA